MRSIAVTDSRTRDYSHKDLDLLFRTASYNNLSNDEQDKYENEMTTKWEYEAYARECAERAHAMPASVRKEHARCLKAFRRIPY